MRRNLLRILPIFLCIVSSKASLCNTENGQPNIIVDIQESRGQQINQTAKPEFLPITGIPDEEISLQIFSSTKPVFELVNKKLQLIAPLDRDSGDLSSVIVQVSCTVRSTGRRRNIPVIVRVSDVNDNAPRFQNEPYWTQVPEDLPVGGVVYSRILAEDHDAGINKLVEYKVVRGEDSSFDGFGVFEFRASHQPVLTTVRELSYERQPSYLVTVVASDRALNPSDRLSSTTTVTVQITRAVNRQLTFKHQQYFAKIQGGAGVLGTVNIEPERISLVETNTDKSFVRYSLDDGTPSNYADYFQIHPSSGFIRQMKPVDQSEVQKFELLVKVEEVGAERRSSVVPLVIIVESPNLHPPVLVATSDEGVVEENAPRGTVVAGLNKDGSPLQLRVFDQDLGAADLRSQFRIELTTSVFQVNQDGYLEVATNNLDRDPPNPSVHSFQAIARQINGDDVTAPIFLKVHVKDVNDNSPRFLSMKPVSLEAGDSRRVVTQAQARDDDWAENGEISYRLVSATNNGENKFSVNSRTGIVEVAGPVANGERYLLTIEARDGGGKASQGIIEIVIVAGPNLRAPVFQKDSYEVFLSEGTALNASVVTVQARDPEGEEVSYSIVSGNELRHFAISRRTGTIFVAALIDREELSRYTLIVKAEDPSGLFSRATVQIRVTDINDRNPEFVDLPYVFRVKESDFTGYIGRVHARDADLDLNGQVRYSIPAESIFAVNPQTGEIRSKIKLDYEKEKVHYITVTAKDGGLEPRIATATVTVLVSDVPDEPPRFAKARYDINVPENEVDYNVLQVKAEDADSDPSITYVIKQGDDDKFYIDSKTGTVRTRRPLDYERQREFILTIGTLENNDLADPAASVRVVINVQDRNDVPPIFTTSQKPIRLQSTVPVGHVITTLVAIDTDGSSPNNIVRYEMVNNEKASRFFRLDPDSGILQVKDDLRKDFQSEYSIEIKAYDLGTPSLSSTTVVLVFVDHVVPVAGEVSPGFSDHVYTASVAEDALANTLIKNLSIINKPKEVVPISCDIVSGNEKDAFFVKDTVDRNCELRLKREILDFEKTQSYSLTVRLKTVSTFMEVPRTARVDVMIIDVNDNAPEFLFHLPEHRLTANKFYATIPADAQISTILYQVQAEDKDSGALGQILYEISEDKSNLNLFSMESSTGIIRSSKTVDLNQVSPYLPLKLSVKARDNPGHVNGYRETTAPLIVNIVEQQHRLVLLIKASAEQVHYNRSELLDVIQQQTGLIIRIEKIQPKQTGSSNTQYDPSSCEVWFHCIDPQNDAILPKNHPRINSSLMSTGAYEDLSKSLASQLQLQVSEIYPLQDHSRPTETLKPLRGTAQAWEGVPAALIAVAGLVFVLALAGSFYLCVLWRRYKSAKLKHPQPFIIIPRYDSVVSDPNPKEYETQMLQLSVNTEESDSSADFKMDVSTQRNHAYHFNEIPHSNPAVPQRRSTNRSSGRRSCESSSSESDLATLRASSLAGNGFSEFSTSQFFRNQSPIPTNNPIYAGYGSDEDVSQYASATNCNVTFKSKLSHLGIAEASTEL